MKGFSLIELMFVLILLSIISFYAVPSFENLFLSNKIKVQTQILFQALRLARTEAIVNDQAIVVCPLIETKQECGVNWSSGISILVKKNKRLIQQFYFAPQIKIIWNRNNKPIIFAPSGVLASQNGSFIIKLNTDRILRLCLSHTGRARVCQN